MLAEVSKLNFPKPSSRKILFSFFSPMYSVFTFLFCVSSSGALWFLCLLPVFREMEASRSDKGKDRYFSLWSTLNPEICCQNSLPLQLWPAMLRSEPEPGLVRVHRLTLCTLFSPHLVVRQWRTSEGMKDQRSDHGSVALRCGKAVLKWISRTYAETKLLPEAASVKNQNSWKARSSKELIAELDTGPRNCNLLYVFLC